MRSFTASWIGVHDGEIVLGAFEDSDISEGENGAFHFSLAVAKGHDAFEEDGAVGSFDLFFAHLTRG